ncbi:hypothetical protein [Streptomyces hydrogenans]|uniref:Uncharacterized protein n=1 Tax=Streptomyces hydrogenans TaxID=1873719 RepID=A0ABQ3PJJ4_9ACTN|nr:hypothetical protein [Streptomyces hydrogenans]GHG10154.1 hypothetical protein GCM10018784_23570 [Streptomyces hydrogenans]GHI25191.1 hypothetical protein Shyd_65620 [Streptomyces hydrogenans]
MPMDVRGNWGLVQSNGATVTFSGVTQDPDSGYFQGQAKVGTSLPVGIEGVATDDEISFKVKSGIYFGSFNFQGWLWGFTVDGQNGTSQATWFATKQFSSI